MEMGRSLGPKKGQLLDIITPKLDTKKFEKTCIYPNKGLQR